MKELSLEQKAQRYDEAIERYKAKQEYESQKVHEFIEYLFPELKESEDEKIRKELIAEVKEQIDCIPAPDCRDKEDEKALKRLNKWLAWLEKQGKQKFADKVEPKFHEGDWINGYYTNYKVLSVNNNGYLVEDVDGNKINILFEKEKFHHLFTIADAKDGDVLAYNDGSLAIFHYRLNGLNAGLYMSHVLLTDKIEFKQTCAIGNSHPATKEQRDTLMKAMADAGYSFDFEKKELKKIDQNLAEQNVDNRKLCNIVIEELSKYSGNEVCKAPWALDSTGVQYPLYFAELGAKWQKEQKPSWSESWSEEDEKQARQIERIVHDDGCTQKLQKQIADWLKSLKDRYTWKPSEEQMRALEHFARSVGESGYASPYDQQTKLLYSLLEQLKQL